MRQKILLYLDYQFIHFYIAKYLQEQNKFDLFGIIDLNEKPKRFFDKQDIVKFKKIWNLRENVIGIDKSPNLEYLKTFENRYGINLWSIAFSERKFYPQFNEYYNFEYNEVLSILEKECRFFEKVLNEETPDFLLINATDWHHMYLLSELCKAKGIKVLMLDLAKIGTRCKLEDYQDSTFEKETYSVSSFEEAQDYLKKESRTSQAKAEAREFASSYRMKIKGMLELFFNQDDLYEKHYTNFGKTKLNIIKNEVKNIFQSRVREGFLKKNTKRQIDEFEKFVYYPLHFEPERVLLIDSPQFPSQLEVILNIAKSLPVGYTLLVKEHPVMRTVGWRDIAFYKEILDMPNVRLIDTQIDNEEILKKCSLVITITGTTAIEAVFYKKPSIVLGKIWGEKQLQSSLFKINDWEELPKTIKKAIKSEIKINELNNYINWIEENTFSFNHNRYVLDLWNKFYYGGNLVNVNIPVKQMMEFLKNSQLETVCNVHLREILKNKNHN